MIQLNGRLNKTGVISPRFNVQVTQIESWVNLLLPARGFGIIILVSVRFPIGLLCAEFVLDDLVWHPGPRRGSSQKCWRKTPGLCVLDVDYLVVVCDMKSDSAQHAL